MHPSCNYKIHVQINIHTYNIFRTSFFYYYYWKSFVQFKRFLRNSGVPKRTHKISPLSVAIQIDYCADVGDTILLPSGKLNGVKSAAAAAAASIVCFAGSREDCLGRRRRLKRIMDASAVFDTGRRLQRPRAGTETASTTRFVHTARRRTAPVAAARPVVTRDVENPARSFFRASWLMALRRALLPSTPSPSHRITTLIVARGRPGRWGHKSLVWADSARPEGVACSARGRSN